MQLHPEKNAIQEAIFREDAPAHHDGAYEYTFDALPQVCRCDEGEGLRIYPEHIIPCGLDELARYRYVW